MQKIKVSLIGYGYWGAKLARNFQNSNFFNLVSIIDTSQKNLTKAKKDFPLVRADKNYKDILKIKNISLVIISTPTKTHAEIAKFAIEQDKHVLVEKPLSLTLNEVTKLENLAKKNKKSKIRNLQEGGTAKNVKTWKNPSSQVFCSTPLLQKKISNRK